VFLDQHPAEAKVWSLRNIVLPLKMGSQSNEELDQAKYWPGIVIRAHINISELMVKS
jgi:hypothetical protein